MKTPSANREQLKRRQEARVQRLKRRVAAASVVGFASLFALAAQHVVRGANAANVLRAQSARSSTRSGPTTFFDQQDGGFQFEDGTAAPSQSSLPPPPPLAQTSVS